MTTKKNNFTFDCYEENMSSGERRAYLRAYEDKLQNVVYGDIEDMTTNEAKALWRKIYGNSQNASPLTSYLGSIINDLCAEIYEIKNKKKSELRKKTILLNKKQEQLDDIEDSLQEKDQTLNSLSVAYQSLKDQIKSLDMNQFNTQFEYLSEKIEQAKINQNLLLDSISVLSKKIKDNQITIIPSELPHYNAGIKRIDLLSDED